MPKPNLRCGWACPTGAPGCCWIWPGVVWVRWIGAAVEGAGYDGPIEVEVINREAWERPGDEVVAEVCPAFLAHA